MPRVMNYADIDGNASIDNRRNVTCTLARYLISLHITHEYMLADNIPKTWIKHRNIIYADIIRPDTKEYL